MGIPSDLGLTLSHVSEPLSEGERVSSTADLGSYLSPALPFVYFEKSDRVVQVAFWKSKILLDNSLFL